MADQSADQQTDHKNIDAKEDQMCQICWSDVTDRAMPANCDHEFCFECIKTWSQNHNRCPVCRRVYVVIRHNIVSEDECDRLKVINPEAMSAILRQIVPLYLKVIGLRNLILRRKEELQTLDSKDSSEAIAQDIEVNAMNDDINRLNGILSLDSPTEEQLRQALVSHENQLNEIQDELLRTGEVDIILFGSIRVQMTVQERAAEEAESQGINNIDDIALHWPEIAHFNGQLTDPDSDQEEQQEYVPEEPDDQSTHSNEEEVESPAKRMRRDSDEPDQAGGGQQIG